MQLADDAVYGSAPCMFRSAPYTVRENRQRTFCLMSKITHNHSGAAVKHNGRVRERGVLAAAGACGGKLEPGNERRVL